MEQMAVEWIRELSKEREPDKFDWEQAKEIEHSNIKRMYTEEDIQKVLDGFTNEAPGEYIKTNFIGLLNKG